MIRSPQIINPFANVFCPYENFILETGEKPSCNRAYCPFLHTISKRNGQTNNNTRENLIVPKIATNFSNQTNQESHQQKTKASRTHKKPALDIPVYVPTPIAQLEREKAAADVKNKIDATHKQEIKKMPIWRKTENVNSYDYMMEEMQHKDFERICRRTSKTIIDTLFGEEESETTRTVNARKKSASVWTDNKHDKKRISKQAGGTKKDIEVPWTHNERQILVDLLSDEDNAKKITSIPTTSATKSKQTPNSLEKKTICKSDSISIVSATTSSSVVSLQSQQKTLPSTLKKGDQRKAHLPKIISKNKLIPLEPNNKKVALQIRQARLALIYAEYTKICTENTNMAVESALYEEKAVLDKCAGRLGYVAAIPNVIKRLRDFAANNGKQRKNSVVSHQNMLLGKHAGSVTVGLHRAQQVAQHKTNHFSELDFYNVLAEKYLLSDEQLWANGYPRWVDPTMEIDEDETPIRDSDISVSALYKQKVEIRQSELDANKTRAQKPFLPDSELKRICTRCGNEYQLTEDGQYAKGSGECVYHWGKAWKKRIQGSVESRYTCCHSPLDVRGCVVAGSHITQTVRLSTLEKYAETPKPFGVGDPRSKKVYALDCEMVYSIWGPEVARLTVVDVLGELILDVLIRPEHQLIDCNTRFSGLTEEQIVNAECDLENARERFFELTNSETILIGHSLESDLRAMRIVHNRVVDTSVVFPHRLGPPQKRALKTLASEILQLIIQEDVGGHDSKEDALTCMRIMLKHCR